MTKVTLFIITGCCLQFFGIEIFYSVKKISRDDQRSKMSGKIVGGVEVPISMYPHVALITQREMVECGGSVISDRVVLTAAHCFSSPKTRVVDVTHYAVYLGSSQALKGAKYLICKVVLHDLYERNDLAYYAYDIAVILLRAQIIFGPTIKKIEIAPNTQWRKQNQYLAIAGFGLTDNNGETAKNLKATKMQYVNSDLCNRSQTDDGDTMIVVDHMFCMLSTRWSSDCFGDSGSGVIWKHKYIVGLVALGRATYCASDTMPSMYTDVVYFKDWINEKVEHLESQSVDSFCPKLMKLSSIKKTKFEKADSDNNKQRTTIKPKKDKVKKKKENFK